MKVQFSNRLLPPPTTMGDVGNGVLAKTVVDTTIGGHHVPMGTLIIGHVERVWTLGVKPNDFGVGRTEQDVMNRVPVRILDPGEMVTIIQE